jgi:peroxiredoxin
MEHKSSAKRKNTAKPAKRSKHWYGLAGLAVVVGIVVTAMMAQNQGAPPSTLSASSAAASSSARIQGNAEALELSAYAGKVVVVNFMAGWCQPCWAEIPGFVEVYETYKDQGLVMIGVSLQTPPEQTEAMITQLGISYPVYQDEQGQVAQQRYGLRAMPTTFVFDRQGQQVRRLEGEVSASVLRDILKELL